MNVKNLVIPACLAVSVYLVSACGIAIKKLPTGVTPVQATWLYGKHVIPARYTRAGQTITYQHGYTQPHWAELARLDVKTETRVPVVLYLHGCKGMGGQARRFSELLVDEGYAVFMPDSFQRPGRLACREQGSLIERVALRTQEVEYALEQIRKLPWVDHTRVILMGFSEGGNTTDNWSKPGFAAHLVMGSACTLVDGKPAAPAGVPVLAIVGANDEYRPGKSCTVNNADGISRSVVIPNAGHAIAQYRQTREAIRAFLKSCCPR